MFFYALRSVAEAGRFPNRDAFGTLRSEPDSTLLLWSGSVAETLTPEQVRKVARLARLKLTEEELQRLTPQLSDVLKYVDMLSEVETGDVEPMAHAIEVHNVLRPDQARDSLPREEALANAPNSDGRYFLVPQIIEGA